MVFGVFWEPRGEQRETGLAFEERAYGFRARGGAFRFKTARDQIGFDEKLEVPPVDAVVAMVQHDELGDARDVRFRITAGSEKVLHHLRRFLSLVFGATVAVFLLAASDCNVVQNRGSVQKLPVVWGKGFAFAQQSCERVDVQNMLCAAQMTVFIAERIEQKTGFIGHGAITSGKILLSS